MNNRKATGKRTLFHAICPASNGTAKYAGVCLGLRQLVATHAFIRKQTVITGRGLQAAIPVPAY